MKKALAVCASVVLISVAPSFANAEFEFGIAGPGFCVTAGAASMVAITASLFTGPSVFVVGPVFLAITLAAC